MEIKYIFNFEEVLQCVTWQVIDSYAIGMEKQKKAKSNFLFSNYRWADFGKGTIYKGKKMMRNVLYLWFLIWVNSVSSLIVSEAFTFYDFGFMHSFHLSAS